jgi:hypothetical protein
MLPPPAPAFARGVRVLNSLKQTPLKNLWFALLALVPHLFGHSAFNLPLKYLPASFVPVILLGERDCSGLVRLWFLGCYCETGRSYLDHNAVEIVLFNHAGATKAKFATPFLPPV